MIKINLLEQRKKTKKRSDKGQQTLAVGFGIVLAAAALAYWFGHRPLAAEVERYQQRNADLEAENEKIKKQTKNLSKMQAAVKAAEEQQQAIEQLRQARAVPAWFLAELSNILTRGRQPSMSTPMERRIQTDPNRQWQETWNPKNVWITSLEERNGQFTLKGAAQSDSDMTQLALRMQASMFFQGVQPEGGEETSDRDSGLTYYKFTITGKVRY